MLIYNVDTLDGLSNGQLGFVQQIVKARDGQLDKIIIKFNNINVGRENQKKFKIILKNYPDCSVIEHVMRPALGSKRG